MEHGLDVGGGRALKLCQAYGCGDHGGADGVQWCAFACPVMSGCLHSQVVASSSHHKRLAGSRRIQVSFNRTLLAPKSCQDGFEAHYAGASW